MPGIIKPKSFKKQIQTTRLNLRPILNPTFEIATNIYNQIATHREHFAYLSFWDIKRPEEEFKNLSNLVRMFNSLEAAEYGIYLRNSGTLVGFVTLHTINWHNGTAELAVWLFPEFLHQGYMTEAVIALQDYFFGIGGHRLVWQVASDNKASIRIAKKLGFVKEGILREGWFNKYFNKYENQIIFSKIVSDWKS